jgi:DNA-binding NarL/FixJ family response regulator
VSGETDGIGDDFGSNPAAGSRHRISIAADKGNDTNNTGSDGLNGVGEERIRVLVVGESPVVRAGLEATLGPDRFEVVGSCDIARSAAMLEATAAEAVFMDTRSFNAFTSDESASKTGNAKLPSVALTPREVEVLRLLADGTSNKIIAHRLGISDHTVKFHITSILSKMNAGTRTEAVTLGVRMGLVYL